MPEGFDPEHIPNATEALRGGLHFLLPIVVVRAGRAPGSFIWVSIGGALIGVGGIALAFLKAGNQLLFFSSEVVFAILGPLLLLMTLAFAWGFLREMKAEENEDTLATT